MTIFTIILVLLFVVGIPYLIYEAFIDDGGYITKLFSQIIGKDDRPIDKAHKCENSPVPDRDPNCHPDPPPS